MDRDTLQNLLDRVRQGDDAARRELIGGAYERLRHLARTILHEDFPRLDRFHQTTSVVHAAALRLLQALDKIQPQTVGEFFTLAARHTRWVLLDLAARQDHRPPEVDLADDGEGFPQDRILGNLPGERNDEPQTLAMWTEFHRQVQELPTEEREVVDLYWYFGLSQAEAAGILGIHPKEFSRRWIKARRKLAAWVPGLADHLAEQG